MTHLSLQVDNLCVQGLEDGVPLASGQCHQVIVVQVHPPGWLLLGPEGVVAMTAGLVAHRADMSTHHTSPSVTQDSISNV